MPPTSLFRSGCALETAVGHRQSWSALVWHRRPHVLLQHDYRWSTRGAETWIRLGGGSRTRLSTARPPVRPSHGDGVAKSGALVHTREDLCCRKIPADAYDRLRRRAIFQLRRLNIETSSTRPLVLWMSPSSSTLDEVISVPLAPPGWPCLSCWSSPCAGTY